MRAWILLLLLSTGAFGERFLLRYVQTGEVIADLSPSYSHLKFWPCPGGFKVHGASAQLKAIRKRVKELDVPQVEEWVAIENGDRGEMVSLLTTLVSGTTFELSGDYHLTVRGSRPDVQQALELIEQLDRPLDKVTVELRVVLDVPEMKHYLGANWIGQLVDEPPAVKHWVAQEPAEPFGVPLIGQAESVKFANLAPWVLSYSRLQARRGDDISLGAKEDGSEPGLRWNVTATVKQDGYAVMKVLPCLNDAFGGRRFTTDARVKMGETIMLAGLGRRAEDLGLAGEGPILLMITVRSGW